MFRRFQEATPKVHPTAYIHPSAEIIGRVRLQKYSSIWPMVVLRGDIEPITVGEMCNIQDNTVVHTTHGLPVVLGKGVTIGHAAVIHGTRIGPYCLIGMGAILLDGSRIGPECLIGAGAVVTENARIPPRSLVLGIPGKVVRKLRTDELALLHKRAKDYVRYARQHREESFPINSPL
jgi:carbonic anhydrase/acetyltransferase-like protein (isoleucine patch superfamily)